MESSNSTEECTSSTAEDEPECYAILVGLKRKSSSPEETTDEESYEEDMEPDLTKPSSCSDNDDDDNNECEKQQKADSVSDNDDNSEEEVNSSSAIGGKRRMRPLQNENDEAGNGYSFQTPTTPRDQIIRRDVRLRTPWAPRRNPNLRRKYGIIHVRQPDFTQELSPFEVMPYNASL